MAWWDQIGTQFGDAMVNMQMPFGMAPPEGFDRQSAIRNGALNLGMGILANSKDRPAEAIGKGYAQAQDRANDQQWRGLQAQQMLFDMDEKKKKRAQEEQRQKMLSKALEGLSPEQRALAEANPEAFADWKFKSMFQPPDARAKLGLNPQYGVDAEGNPVLLQIGDNGQAIETQMPDGVTLSKEPIKLDAGTHFILLDPITRQAVGTIPKNVQGEAAAGALGKEQGTAQAQLPSAKITADQTIQKIDELLNDKDLSGVSDWESYLPDAGVAAVSGSGALGLRRRVEQLKGTAFLEAYNGLRGGGQITEVEGKKAEDALARLDMAQSDADYVQALKDFREAVKAGYAKLEARAGKSPAPQTGGWTIEEVP